MKFPNEAKPALKYLFFSSIGLKTHVEDHNCVANILEQFFINKLHLIMK